MKAETFAVSTAVAMSCLFSPCLHAETVNTTAELQASKNAYAYVNSRPMLMGMYRVGIAADRALGLQFSCQAQYQVKPEATMVVSPLEFVEGKANPSKGVWLSRFHFERCGDAKVYNALFTANGNGDAPAVAISFPGSSNAGPRLLKEAIGIVAAQGHAVLKDCDGGRPFDMRVTQPAHDVVEGSKVTKGVWNEIWTFSACGKMVDVPVTFVPDANGGGVSFIAGQAKARDAAPAP